MNMKKEILEHEDGALYKVIDIKGTSYQGYLVAVYDPSRVSIATTKYLGKKRRSYYNSCKKRKCYYCYECRGIL